MKRKYGCLRDKRLKLERIYRPTFKAPCVYPPAFDLDSPAFELLDQGSLGSCTGFGCKRVAWYGLLKAGQKIEPSALFIYFNERDIEGDIADDNGASISDGIESIKQRGVCTETDWPYDVSKFAIRPPQNAFDDALQFQALQSERINADENLIQNIKDALFNQRLPVVFGADLFPQFESDAAARTGLIDMPRPGSTPLGGHCMVIRGWNDAAPGGPRMKIQNSWGAWGDNGCAWILFEYLKIFASDLWAIPQME